MPVAPSKASAVLHIQNIIAMSPSQQENDGRAGSGDAASWSRSQRMFVYFSEAASGVNCGAEQDPKACKTCATQTKTPSSCSYAAAMQGNIEQTLQPGQLDTSMTQSSCPVVGDAKATDGKLHPLTHLPLELYTDTTSTASTNTSSQQATANAQAAGVPDVPAGLRAERQRSTIPMAAPQPGQQLPKHQQGVVEQPQGSGQEAQPSVWTYPSEQMFYKAMQRKGWQPDARDMRTVVAIHNAVNERAWQEVCAWEALHCKECKQGPRLAKFQGRPADLSPKARLLNFLGYAPPFDRHDWIVDRCGKQVRYVIDFYSGVPKPGGPPAAMWLDTRPGLDSFEAAWDRVYMAAKYAYDRFLYSQPTAVPSWASAAATNGPQEVHNNNSNTARQQGNMSGST